MSPLLDGRCLTKTGSGMAAALGAKPGEAPASFVRPYLVALLFLSPMVPGISWSQPPVAEPTPVMRTIAQPARTGSVYIGSVMAMLATFEDAGILPPEGTPQANRIIKAVIQFQSAFLKSDHPAVRHFFTEAHRIRLGPRAEEVETSFRQSGWSADTFDAVITAGQIETAWNADGLTDGFREFNIGKQDFDILAELYQQSSRAFSTQGKSFQEVYAQRRREMPGAKSE